MREINKHGLSRYIPKPVERKVRQNSYFGCVICGAGITTIDHVDPEFNDCKEHDPEKMALLCGSCHIKKTKGIIGVPMVKKAKQNPFCKTKNPPSDFLDFGTTKPNIQFGNSLFINPKSLITINGESILSIREPNKQEDPDRLLLNAIFHNLKGEESFRIDNNVWHAEIDNWDVETTAKKITVRTGKGNIILEIENIPENKFIVHRLNMVYKGYYIQADRDGVEIVTPSGKTMIVLDKDHTIEGDVPIEIYKDGTLINNLEVNGNLKIKGGSDIVVSNSKINGRLEI